MITKQRSEQLQQDIITHCDGLPDELITELCQVVVNYEKQNEGKHEHDEDCKYLGFGLWDCGVTDQH